MELATSPRDSGVGGAVCAGYRSEGLSRCSSAPSSLQFSWGRVNECSDRLKRLRRRWPTSVGVISPGDRVGSDRGVAVRAVRLALRRSWFCEHSGLRAVRLNCRAISRRVGRNAPRSLAVIWFHATRLETRTKESDACASLRVTETLRHNESEQVRPPGGRIIDRLILLSERFE